MNSKLLSVLVTSVVVATSAIALPSRSLADDVTDVDTHPATEEVTDDSGDNADINAEASICETIDCRSSHRNRVFRRNNQLNRPSNDGDANNAGGSSGKRWIWF
jgi:hypothetical protein